MPVTVRVFGTNFDSYVRDFHVYQDEWFLGYKVKYFLVHIIFTVKVTNTGMTVAEVMLQTLHFILSVTSCTY